MKKVERCVLVAPIYNTSHFEVLIYILQFNKKSTS